MRIISGEKRGAKLFPPEDRSIRPTSDRVKESVFAIIQFKIADAEILDICCGTGNLGLEALSRGAKSTTFVDIDEKSISLLKQNIDKLRFNDRCKVIKNDALAALQELTTNKKQFDYILFDPPYKDVELYKDVIEFVLLNSLLNENGFLIVEHNNRYQDTDITEQRKFDQRKYGSTYISFYR